MPVEGTTDRRTARGTDRRCLRGLYRRAIIAAAAITILSALTAQAQISVYPPVLYSGTNVLTINATNGLRRVMGYLAGRWTEMPTGSGAPFVRIAAGPSFAACARTTRMSIFIMKTDPSRLFQLRVEDCSGNVRTFDFSESEEWRLYKESFGNVIEGSTACHTFRVETRANSIVIDSVSIRSPQFSIRYDNGRPPLRIYSGTTWTYDVCFRATKAGYLKMPVLVYLRRQYPAGGYTNFIVADTAFINVIRDPRAPVAPPVTRPVVRPPTRPRILAAQPKPIIIQRPRTIARVTPRPVIKPVVKPDTIRTLPPIALMTPRGVPVATLPAPDSVTAAVDPPLPSPIDLPISDPTPHRVVLMPTARSVDSGRFFVANYELAGWLLGYGLNDRTTILAGGLVTPRSIDYNLVLTAGARYELLRTGLVRGALGLQANYSTTDLSSIVLVSPYAVVSLGDDDQRISGAVAYTWRHHTPKDTTPEFNKQAVAVAIGGDYRFATHWKVAAEAYLLQDANYEPMVVTLRYFNERFAIDAGLGFDLGLSSDDAAPTGLRLAPVVTATVVW